MSIKTIFLGSNWEALATLKILNEDERFNLVAVITQPDKPVGRKKEILPSDIKVYCQENNIEVIHTEKIPERYEEALKKHKPELIVCKSFGEIIPESFLMYPKYKSINIHFSLLPKYRGAVPIQAAIMNGDTESGITIVQMVAKLDAGPVLATFKEPIHPDDTNQTLRERLVERCCIELPAILQSWVNGEITPIPQNDDEATYCWQKDISKESAQIDWENESADLIERKIRALLPWPVSWTMFQGKRMKIYRARVIDATGFNESLKPGDFKVIDSELYIGTNKINLFIQPLEVQVEGRNRMNSQEFVLGNKI